MNIEIYDVGPFIPGSPWTAALTTESSASSYGIPVLRVRRDGEFVGDFGPDDLLSINGINTKLAGSIIAAWASLDERTDGECEAAK